MNEQLTKIADGWMQKAAPTFSDLSESIIQTHQSAQYSAIKAVNQMATLRNWLIGCYIVEYEQKGSDRAKYGDRLLKRLEERVNTKGLNETLFLAARRFYSFYPQIADIISPSIHPILSDESSVDNKIFGDSVAGIYNFSDSVAEIRNTSPNTNQQALIFTYPWDNASR
jgi:hypothetical protein